MYKIFFQDIYVWDVLDTSIVCFHIDSINNILSNKV